MELHFSIWQTLSFLLVMVVGLFKCSHHNLRWQIAKCKSSMQRMHLGLNRCLRQRVGDLPPDGQHSACLLCSVTRAVMHSFTHNGAMSASQSGLHSVSRGFYPSCPPGSSGTPPAPPEPFTLPSPEWLCWWRTRPCMPTASGSGEAAWF